MLRFSRLLLVAAGSGPFDPFKILGVKPGASKDEIKKAYHRLALRFHPDSGAEGNAERFAAVNEAYEAVKDGKWKPSAQQEQKAAEEGGGGWNPKMRMYVYEQPGSTTEGYVSGDTQKYLRLFMKREEVQDEALQSGTAPPSVDSGFASFGDQPSPFPPSPGSGPKNSVHHSDEADFAWNYGGRDAPARDPLTHR